MKKILICIFTVCILFSFSTCSKKQNENKTVNLNNAKSSYAENNQTAESPLDGEVFDKLPDEAVDSFNYVTEQSKKIFANADGEWMYGYKGTSKIGKDECYVFVVYTYKDKTHVKEGTIAKNSKNNDLYVLNETTGEYVKSEIPDDGNKTSWASTETLAFIK